MLRTFRIIVRAADYPFTLGFYKDALECPIIMDWDRGPAEKGTVFELGFGEIEILAQVPGENYVQPQGFEIAIEVNDVDNFYQQLQNKGWPIHSPLADKHWGHRTFSINAPDNLKIIFFSVLE